MSLVPETGEPVAVGRYLLCDPIGGGGMAQVHLGRVLGAAGFSRVVAIKRLHPAMANDPDLTTMLVDEARLVSRIRHPNVVPTLDVVAAGRELLLVMEYVHGLPVSRLLTLTYDTRERISPGVSARIALDILAGLHAAHEAKSERGHPLEIVHRDVSPQNVIVDTEGSARVVDFGIAKAEGKLTMTREGEIKGKLSYMAPEQLRGEEVDRRADVYAVGIILWELFTGRRLFDREVHNLVAAVRAVMTMPVEPPSSFSPVSPAVDEVVLRALRADRDERFATAAEMATALSSAMFAAEAKEVAALIARVGSDVLEERSQLLGKVEQLSAIHDVPAKILVRPSTSPPPPPPHLPLVAPPPEPLPLPLPLPPPPPPLPAARPAAGSRGPVLALALALVLLMSAAVVVVAAIARRASRRAAAAPPLVTLVSAPVGSSPPAADGARGAVSPPLFPVPAPASASDSTPAAHPSGHPPGRGHSRTAPSASSAPSAFSAPPPDCNPPYAIDARGIRIPRRECL